MAQTTLPRYLAPKLASEHCREDRKGQTDVQVRQLADVEPNSLTKDGDKERPGNTDSPVEARQDMGKALAVPRCCITRVRASHIDAIKRLTSSTLPMRYPNKFFAEVVTDQDVGDLARVVLFEGTPAGWIRCRLEPGSTTAPTKTPRDPPESQIYIQALCLLAPYRQRGLALQLLQEITCSDVLQKYGATSIYAHVWENNEDALEWYERQGFKRLILVDQYYRRLLPSGAWIVRRELLRASQSDAMENKATQSKASSFLTR